MSIAQVYDSYAQKVADICRVPLEAIVRLREMNMLDSKAVRDALIFHDYWELTKTGKLSSNQIYEKLSSVYDVEKRKIQSVVKQKRKRVYYCRLCGAPISKRKSFQNGGICDKCVANNAEQSSLF